MSRHALFPAQLIHAGWEEVQVTVFAFFFLEITETRYRSPYTHRVHKLHKALRKERQAAKNGYAPLFT